MNKQNLRRTRWVRSAINAVLQPPIRFFPLRQSLRGYRSIDLGRDARAAFLASLVAFVQGLTCASIAGLPAHFGIASSIVAAIVGGAFSGSRVLVIGPTNAIAILILSTFAGADFSPEQRAQAIPVLMLMTGLILLASSWFRIANLTQYVSRSVVVAYITGAATLIAITQFRVVLGLDIEDTGILIQTVAETVRHIPGSHLPSLAVGLGTAAVFALFHFRIRRVPASVAAFLAGLGFAYLAESGGHSIRHTVLGVPTLLPVDGLSISFDQISQLSRVALALALMAFLEASVIGKRNASKTGVRFDGNQHMYAIGLANFATAFFSGMPASGSTTRSRLNLQSGAVTPMAAILSGLFCALIFVATRNLIPSIAQTVIATIAICMAFTLYNRDALRVILRSTPSDVLVLIVTLAACFFFPLDAAIYMGAGISIVFFLKKVGVPELVEYAFNPEGQLAEIAEPEQRQDPDISIVHVEGDLFFGAAEIFLDQARRVFEDPNLKVIILRMKNAHHLDATCAMAIRELLEFAGKNDRHVIVSGAHRQIYRVFRNSGLLDLVGRESFFMDVPSNPTLSTRNALKRAQELLGQQKANIRIYVDPAKQTRAEDPSN